MYANLRGRIYVCSRTMSARYRLLANEGESIYGHSHVIGGPPAYKSLNWRDVDGIVS